MHNLKSPLKMRIGSGPGVQTLKVQSTEIFGNQILKCNELSNRFDVVEKLGSGGCGTVWRVLEKVSGRPFAIKTLRPELASNAASLERFKREATLAKELTHPNIGSTYCCESDENGQLYILMDFVSGESLAELLQREGPLSEERAMDLFFQIREALQYAHAKGVVHRDVKPGNIIISKTPSNADVAKLIDFGVARNLYGEFENTNHLTVASQLLGSPSYMSPEQILGNEAGPESDYYSLGCVLHEMLTGKLPFQGENPMILAMQHCSAKPDLSGIAKQAKPFITGYLEKNSEIRQQNILFCSGSNTQNETLRNSSDSCAYVAIICFYGIILSSATISIYAMPNWNCDLTQVMLFACCGLTGPFILVALFSSLSKMLVMRTHAVELGLELSRLARTICICVLIASPFLKAFNPANSMLSVLAASTVCLIVLQWNANNRQHKNSDSHHKKNMKGWAQWLGSIAFAVPLLIVFLVPNIATFNTLLAITAFLVFVLLCDSFRPNSEAICKFNRQIFARRFIKTLIYGLSLATTSYCCLWEPGFNTTYSQMALFESAKTLSDKQQATEVALSYPHTTSGDLGRMTAVKLAEDAGICPEIRMSLCSQIIGNQANNLDAFKALACADAAKIADKQEKTRLLDQALNFLERKTHFGFDYLKLPIWSEQNRLARNWATIPVLKECFQTGDKELTNRALNLAISRSRSLSGRERGELSAYKALSKEMF